LATGAAQTAGTAVASDRSEVWTLVAAAALVLILLEWIVALRRTPRRPRPAPEEGAAAPGAAKGASS